MPNHLHGIIEVVGICHGKSLHDNAGNVVGTCHGMSLQLQPQPHTPKR